MEEIRNKVREAVYEIVGRPVDDSEFLVSAGVIDSLRVVTLIARLEQKLNFSIPPNNLQPDDFDSVDVIMETLSRVAKPR